MLRREGTFLPSHINFNRILKDSTMEFYRTLMVATSILYKTLFEGSFDKIFLIKNSNPDLMTTTTMMMMMIAMMMMMMMMVVIMAIMTMMMMMMMKTAKMATGKYVLH